MDLELPAYSVVPEPQLSFHPDRISDRDIHPLQGLVRFGPYSRSLLPHLDPIRIATIAPAGEQSRLYDFMRELSQSFDPRERRDYLPQWPGFEQVFRVRVTAAASGCHLELPSDLDDRLLSTERPHVALAEALANTTALLEPRRNEFDVVFLYLPNRWEPGFHGEEDDFDLHDYFKATMAIRDMPSQIVRDDKALLYHCRASVMWRIGLAIYAKAGGVPWKLADASEDTAYIGLSYAIRSKPGSDRFVTCCSQVFDSDGAGLEFVAYDTDDVRIQRDNPFLSRGEMRRVMARSLELFQRRHAGRSPKRLVVHKGSEFKRDEVDGCFDALESATETVDLVHVQQHHGWRGIRIDPPSGSARKGKPSGYPLLRGSSLQLGGREVVLWAAGDQPAATPGKGSYYREGKSIPQPLKLVRHAGHGGFGPICRDVLGLSKMNWNNDALYDRLPVTLGYARVLANVVKRIDHLPSQRIYQFRFFM